MSDVAGSEPSQGVVRRQWYDEVREEVGYHPPVERAVDACADHHLYALIVAVTVASRAWPRR